MKTNFILGITKFSKKDLKKIEQKKGGKIISSIIKDAMIKKSDRNYGACYPWNDDQGGDWHRA